MITFQNSNAFKINELWKKDKSVSTLLVPTHLIESLKVTMFGSSLEELIHVF